MELEKVYRDNYFIVICTVLGGVCDQWSMEQIL